MSEFKKYRLFQVTELRPYEPGESMAGISISGIDHDAGSPKPGDMIRRNPAKPADQWLVNARHFADNFAPVEP
jgi:hypothetical protein